MRHEATPANDFQSQTGVGANPVGGPGGIGLRHRPGVIHDDVDQNPYSLRMGDLDHPREIGFIAERAVDARPVAGPVAMERVGPAIFLIRMLNLLDHRRRPDRRHAEIPEISVLQLGDDPLEVAAHEGPQRVAVLRASVCAVIGGLAIREAVGHQEIDDGIPPERILGGGVSRRR